MPFCILKFQAAGAHPDTDREPTALSRGSLPLPNPKPHLCCQSFEPQVSIPAFKPM